MPADRLLVFARRPAGGLVKAGLSPPLPPDEAATVYEACLRDVLALAAREHARVELWYEDGARAAAYFATEFPHLPRVPLVPGDPGDKLHDAFAWSFVDQAERTVILGSDAPTLPDGALTAAFAGLREADVVLGPTRDGGWYVVGLRSSCWPWAASLFRDPGRPKSVALRETLARAAAEGLSVGVLPGWYAIERPEDLARAAQDARADSHLGRWLAGESGRRYVVK